MRKVITRKGKWKEENFEKDLYWEYCPNSKCRTEELHYPTSLSGAKCPDCKSVLLGKDLDDSLTSRIEFHLEG
jgi:hypothetical protein